MRKLKKTYLQKGLTSPWEGEVINCFLRARQKVHKE